MTLNLICVLALAMCLMNVFVAAEDDHFYCGEIWGSKSGDSVGYFQLKLDKHGWAKYSWSLDLASDNCTSTSSWEDLTYHLHVAPTNSTGDGTYSCASTGGHYDPFFGCSASSSEANDGCADLGRDPADYADHCSSPAPGPSVTVFEYPDGGCEVGDLSSKFGMATPTDTSTYSTATGTALTDFFPPMLANFNAQTFASNPWSSVVFHCSSDGERLACGNFVETTQDAAGTVCPGFTGSEWSDAEEDHDDDAGANNNDGCDCDEDDDDYTVEFSQGGFAAFVSFFCVAWLYIIWRLYSGYKYMCGGSKNDNQQALL